MECMCAQNRPRFILSSERVLGKLQGKGKDQSDVAASGRTASPIHYRLSYSDQYRVVGGEVGRGEGGGEDEEKRINEEEKKVFGGKGDHLAQGSANNYGPWPIRPVIGGSSARITQPPVAIDAARGGPSQASNLHEGAINDARPLSPDGAPLARVTLRLKGPTHGPGPHRISPLRCCYRLVGLVIKVHARGWKIQCSNPA